MTGASVPTESRVGAAVTTATLATIASYAVLGGLLLVTRLTYLGHGF
jgi:hypothetical protein